MISNGVRADTELVCNCCGGEAAAEKEQDLLLPRAEAVARRKDLDP